MLHREFRSIVFALPFVFFLKGLREGAIFCNVWICFEFDLVVANSLFIVTELLLLSFVFFFGYYYFLLLQ